jgi:uncharacterized protein (DUF1778 family)
MPRQPTNAVRVQARITPKGLAAVKRAAEIQGLSVGGFVASAAEEAAIRTIEHTHIIELSAEDQRALAAAILDPSEPTPALRRAVRAHKRLIKTSR